MALNAQPSRQLLVKSDILMSYLISRSRSLQQLGQMMTYVFFSFLSVFPFLPFYISVFSSPCVRAIIFFELNTYISTGLINQRYTIIKAVILRGLIYYLYFHYFYSWIRSEIARMNQSRNDSEAPEIKHCFPMMPQWKEKGFLVYILDFLCFLTPSVSLCTIPEVVFQQQSSSIPLRYQPGT